jgi:hypothetical protein
VEFAVEEFGKIVMHKGQLAANTTHKVVIPENVFKSHKQKNEEAWTVLDPTYRTVYDEGGFDDEGFDPKGLKLTLKQATIQGLIVHMVNGFLAGT